MNPHDDERGLRLAAGGNRFAFAAIVRNRAHDLAAGAAPLVYAPNAKPVSIAIVEAAAGEIDRTRSLPPAPLENSSSRRIQCQQCAAIVIIRRRKGAEVRGRPPSRCALHGLGENWEQLE